MERGKDGQGLSGKDFNIPKKAATSFTVEKDGGLLTGKSL